MGVSGVPKFPKKFKESIQEFQRHRFNPIPALFPPSLMQSGVILTKPGALDRSWWLGTHSLGSSWHSKCCQQILEGLFPSAQLWEVTPGILGPVWSSPVQERQNPRKNHRDDEGTGASPMRRGWGSWNCPAWRRKGSGNLLNIHKYLRRKCNDTQELLCLPKWFLNIRNCILSMRVTNAGTGLSPSFLLSQKLRKISAQVQWTPYLWCFAF